MGFPWGFKSLARHQRNEHGSVVWVRAHFSGVWRIEPPREREREGGSRVPYVAESASPGFSQLLHRSRNVTQTVSPSRS